VDHILRYIVRQPEPERVRGAFLRYSGDAALARARRATCRSMSLSAGPATGFTRRDSSHVSRSDRRTERSRWRPCAGKSPERTGTFFLG
jgi:hypothetical protein